MDSDTFQPPKIVDNRSDAEILASFKIYKSPAVSERNVWAFWNTGIGNSPPWCQRNVSSWARRLGFSFTIHVLDCVNDSPTHISKYIDSALLPECMNKQTLKGPHVGQITSDFVRLPLVYLYGGVWLDVGFLSSKA